MMNYLATENKFNLPLFVLKPKNHTFNFCNTIMLKISVLLFELIP